MGIKDFFSDEYAFKARLLPAIFTVLPVGMIIFIPIRIVLISLFPHFRGLVNCGAVVSVGGCAILVTLWFWSVMMVALARWVEWLVYKDGLYFPTTRLLLWKDPWYPIEYKSLVHRAIEKDFSLRLLSARAEADDEVRARKMIAIAIKSIRDKVRGGRIVGQYNMFYGMVRNTTVGSAFSLFVSIVLLISGASFGCNSYLFTIGVLMSLLYTIVIVLAKPLWRLASVRYAKVLIQEYMSF